MDKDDEVVKTEEDNELEFDSAWSEATADKSKESDDDLDKDLNADESLEDGEENSKADSGDEESDDEEKVDSDASDVTEGDDDSDDEDDDADERTPEELREELKAVEQKLRSAEGRLQSAGKTEIQVEELTKQKNDLLDVLKKGNSSAAISKDGEGKAGSENGDGDEIIPEGFTPEEWGEYKEDFPKQAKLALAQEKRLRAADVKLESAEKLAETASQAAALAEFNQPILSKHADYEEICREPAELQKFIDSQSPALKRAYEGIVESGTQGEIIDLIDRFKKSLPAGDKKTANEDNSKNSDKAAKAKKALAVKSSKSSSPNVNKGEKDMDDFDAAWDERNGKK